MTLRRVVALLWALAGLSACARLALLTESGRIERGRETYVQRCAACHGVAGTGGGPVAAVLKQPPADLTRIAARRDGRFDVQEVAAFIDGRSYVPEHGPREMPVWGRSLGDPEYPPGSGIPRLTSSVIYLVADYLRSIQAEGDPAP